MSGLAHEDSYGFANKESNGCSNDLFVFSSPCQVSPTKIPTYPTVSPTKIPTAAPSTAPKFYPDWANDLTCKNDNNKPQYMVLNPTMWLLDSRESCCKKFFSWQLSDCMQEGDAAPSVLYYPDWAGLNKGCINDGNAPSYMQYNPSMWMFEDLEDCCDRHYLWDLATCLGASATAGSDKWFVDYFLNKCVKECVGDEPCGGLVDGTWVDLFESQSECCSKKMWWNTECDT
ncbi:predicted protein [Thalassiosira pseudonana CCMP1335]|uniref:Uncharacterized protein n=1 Tax=Thalassiosira pseudonana TaxID=35128 RepID=B5YMA1_THAPS|nr:predicted protein [Thalassiosira pseudonana CCMP1335]ACI64216.1 predicted protein [Thalassiosira pseudonana CCMP1335]